MPESYSLVDKLLGKPKVTEKEVLGRKVVYRVLTNSERVTVWRKSPVQDAISAPEAAAIPTLARAIVSIDDVSLSQFQEIQQLQQKFPTTHLADLIEEHLQSYPFTVINELYLGYIDVVNEQQAAFDELKKSSVIPNQEQSGQSANSSGKNLQR